MDKKITNLFPILIIIIIALFGVTACGSNINSIPATTQVTPKQRVFNASFEKVWTATQRALTEDNTFKILDKSSKIMVTEFRTIDAKELSLMQTAFLGKTYKHSYTVNFFLDGSGKTNVNVIAKLQAVQIALLTREENNQNVESYLRQKLFNKISSYLK